MEPAATGSDQLISQTHRQSLSPPCPKSPGSLDPAPVVMDTFSPAIDMVTDAQPADDEMAPKDAALTTPSDVDPLVTFHRDTRNSSVHSLESVPVGSLQLDDLPNEVLFHILTFLDVSDLFSASRTNHLLRDLSTAPILHYYRLRRARSVLPPLLWSPSRPSLATLISRSIFLTRTSVVSRRLARSLVSIRLSRRLAARPTAESLVERSVLPKECVPGLNGLHIAPGLVAKKIAIEKERVKDGLRQWIASKWKGKVREREEGIKRWEESRGVGRVWRLRRFWERVSRGEDMAARGW